LKQNIRARRLGFTTFLILIPQITWAYVYDAFKGDVLILHTNVESLFQPSHNNRKFSSITTVGLGAEKIWEYSRLFVYSAGYHFGTADKARLPADVGYWDDLRFGGQLQFQEWGLLFGAIRFWTKLPNTRDETLLGTDLTDFYFIGIQSFGVPQTISAHLNLGLGIIGAPELLRSQNDYFVYGLRLDAGMFSPLLFGIGVHGFSGFKAHDDKLLLFFSTHFLISELFTLTLDLQAPLITDYNDYADPLDHTSLGGKLQLSWLIH
jgi:hypothetical protein